MSPTGLTITVTQHAEFHNNRKIQEKLQKGAEVRRKEGRQKRVKTDLAEILKAENQKNKVLPKNRMFCGTNDNLDVFFCEYHRPEITFTGSTKNLFLQHILQ